MARMPPLSKWQRAKPLTPNTRRFNRISRRQCQQSPSHGKTYENFFFSTCASRRSTFFSPCDDTAGAHEVQVMVKPMRIFFFDLRQPQVNFFSPCDNTAGAHEVQVMVCRDSFIRMMWLVPMGHDSFIWDMIRLYVTWLPSIVSTSHGVPWLIPHHDSFAYVTWLVHVRAMTSLYMWSCSSQYSLDARVCVCMYTHTHTQMSIYIYIYICIDI